ncbi:MAG: low-specificity L-threonine aldolase [Anaerolineales bacterium]|nr:low-specificity L-threonine aldolase [Anaerolineales bacterium]
MDMIDLRSDTVTKPTPAMREAMAKADVGDDVYGEDPTVNKLQDIASELTGKEAALYVASGTMGNVAATLAHTRRGDEIICGLKSHIYRNEQGAMAALAGVQARPLEEEYDGTLDIQKIESAIQTSDDHHPITRVVAIENTHNICGGVPISPTYTEKLGELAVKHGLILHLDGARMFNAAAALGVSPKEIVGPSDSVSICLSKGLCAPVGSVLCGDTDFIHRARRARKVLGGGMRQAGVLAAAGIIALTEMPERLRDDHQNAKLLARLLSELSGISLERNSASTNMVYFNLDADVPSSGNEVSSSLKEEGILLDLVSPRGFRAVTHYGIDSDMVEMAVHALKDIVSI